MEKSIHALTDTLVEAINAHFEDRQAEPVVIVAALSLFLSQLNEALQDPEIEAYATMLKVKAQKDSDLNLCIETLDKEGGVRMKSNPHIRITVQVEFDEVDGRTDACLAEAKRLEFTLEQACSKYVEAIYNLSEKPVEP